MSMYNRLVSMSEVRQLTGFRPAMALYPIFSFPDHARLIFIHYSKLPHSCVFPFCRKEKTDEYKRTLWPKLYSERVRNHVGPVNNGSFIVVSLHTCVEINLGCNIQRNNKSKEKKSKINHLVFFLHKMLLKNTKCAEAWLPLLNINVILLNI